MEKMTATTIMFRFVPPQTTGGLPLGNRKAIFLKDLPCIHMIHDLDLTKLQSIKLVKISKETIDKNTFS